MVLCPADPTYMIRAIPSNASDNVYCTLLAHSAVHGAMAGYTGFTVGPVNGRHAYIPFYVSSRMTKNTYLVLLIYICLHEKQSAYSCFSMFVKAVGLKPSDVIV